MSEEKPPEPQPQPPLPDIFELPQASIDHWNSITSAQPLLVPFGKHQLDNLMVSLRQNTMAQMALGEALRLLSNNETEAAQAEFRRHQELIRYSYSNLNWFIQHVMTSAVPQEPHNG